MGGGIDQLSSLGAVPQGSKGATCRVSIIVITQGHWLGATSLTLSLRSSQVHRGTGVEAYSSLPFGQRYDCNCRWELYVVPEESIWLD